MDDGAKKERKRMQNRLNQRSLRERKRKDEIRIVCGKRPYRVSRWRVAQLQETRSSPDYSIQRASVQERPSLEQHTESPLAHVENTALLLNAAPESLVFPLSSDHLIRLIHQNVMSGLMNNKYLLTKTTYITKPIVSGPAFVIPPSHDFCDGLTLIHPIIDRPLPYSLHPTPLQMSVPHSSWMNQFPSPRLRDNLIVNESIIDVAELLHDVFGESNNSNIRSPNKIDHDVSITSPREIDQDADVESRGLIIWGDPWDTESWEITQGFMRKWAWLLEGCEDLIEVSNRWRARRHEDPLRWGVMLD